MPDRDPQIEAIDVPGPEDAPDLDLSKVKDLAHLNELATSNTAKVRKLQRIQGALADPSSPAGDLRDALSRRQQLGIKLSRRRDQLKKEQAQDYQKQVLESIRPTTGLLNNSRRDLVDELIQTCEKMKQIRLKNTGQTEYERRLSARLMHWEKVYLNAVRTLDELPPLPSDLS